MYSDAKAVAAQLSGPRIQLEDTEARYTFRRNNGLGHENATARMRKYKAGKIPVATRIAQTLT
jgi:hypothetical protein